MNSIKSQPLFIPLAGQSIFALAYVPLNKNRHETIIICPPDPQDCMRSHGALVLLARRLQQEGFGVLRFDYRGTGDSEGSSVAIDLDSWLQDALGAAEFIQNLWPGMRLSLIGLRLGSCIALRASLRLNIERLLLWDPILDGHVYIKAAESAQKALFSREPTNPPFTSLRYSHEQYWGFAWSESWRRQVAKINIANLEPKAKQCHILLSRADAAASTALSIWTSQNLAVDLQQIGDSLHWGDPLYLNIKAFPAAHLRFIQDLFGGDLHA